MVSREPASLPWSLQEAPDPASTVVVDDAEVSAIEVPCIHNPPAIRGPCAAMNVPLSFAKRDLLRRPRDVRQFLCTRRAHKRQHISIHAEMPVRTVVSHRSSVGGDTQLRGVRLQEESLLTGVEVGCDDLDPSTRAVARIDHSTTVQIPVEAQDTRHLGRACVMAVGIDEP